MTIISREFKSVASPYVQNSNEGKIKFVESCKSRWLIKMFVTVYYNNPTRNRKSAQRAQHTINY